MCFVFFFFKQKTAYEMRISDWSSDVCSSDLGYHGSTVAGASLGGMKGMHAQGGLPIPDIHHIDPPFWFADGGDLTPEDYGLLAARRLEARILELGPERVAAFIGEPIMGDRKSVV